MARKSLRPRSLPGHRNRQRVTVDDLADMTALDLLDHFDAELIDYMIAEVETDPENEADRVERWGFVIDRIPDLYAWVARVHSIYDVLTDRARAVHGQGSEQYRHMRECRDAAEAFQSVVKMRYQSASRMITIYYSERDEQDMPRQR